MYLPGPITLSIALETATNAPGDDTLDAYSTWTHGTFDGSKRLVVVTARHKGLAVGRLLAGCDSEPLELDKIWVDPSFRRQGLAVKMLDSAMKASALKTAYAPTLTEDGEAFWSSIASEIVVDGCDVDRYVLSNSESKGMMSNSMPASSF